MKKRIASLVLTLSMVLTLLPAALAAGSGSCGDGVTWTLAEGKLTISGSGAMNDFTSSSQIPWYDQRSEITAILVEDGVTHVGANAFLNCLSVTTVHMADSVSSIGDSAFASCGSPTYGPALNLPIRLSAIDSYAFMGCNMRYLVIPYGVTSIGEYAFSGCTKFTEVAIPATVTQISSHAFDGCSALTTLSFYGAPDAIGYRAFYGLPSGATVSFNGTQAQWDGIAAGSDLTTEELIFGAGSAVPTVTCLVEDEPVKEPVKDPVKEPAEEPVKESVTLEFADKTSGGVVVVDADHPDLSATLTAPVGAKLTGWTIRLYTRDGAYLATVDDNRRGTISKSPSTLSYTLWKTPSNGKLTFSNFSLTLGETYQYELSAILDEEVYTTGLGKFRLSAPETYTVSFCNPLNMTYSPEIQVTAGQPYGKLPTPTMAGRVFTGWFTAGGEEVTSSTIVELTRDQTLYAHWAQEETPATSQPGNPATGGTAYPSTQSVLVDGSSVIFQAYALKDANGYDTNYVKLRDVAQILNGSAAQFEVGWNGNVNIETGKAYTSNGTEMRTPFSGSRSYAPTTAPTLVNGSAAALEAILLQDDAGNGYTYYKLRDLGAALGFRVDWSAEKGIFIETK